MNKTTCSSCGSPMTIRDPILITFDTVPVNFCAVCRIKPLTVLMRNAEKRIREGIKQAS